jgi:hypothetical protein
VNPQHNAAKETEANLTGKHHMARAKGGGDRTGWA